MNNTMKRCFILIGSLFFISLSNAQDDFRSEIKYVRHEEGSSRIILEVLGYGLIHLTAERDAMENLFNTLFFRGISGTPSSKPLIGLNENVIISSNKIYFQTFFDKKRYLTFVNEQECSVLNGRGKRKKLKCLLSVDIQTLKEDLKNNKIISDYGF